MCELVVENPVYAMFVIIVILDRKLLPSYTCMMYVRS